MSALRELLGTFREKAKTNREAGTYFEELVIQFLRNEPAYRDLYREVEPWAEFAKRNGLDARDVGIDLVAETIDHDYVAIQCKFFEEDHRVQKADIDSFFTASGQKLANDIKFVSRVIVATTSHWSEHAESALANQTIPVTKIDLFALEGSVIDWSRFSPRAEAPIVRAKKQLRAHQETAVKKVLAGFKQHARGKLLMACGTGKTFTSLKIAEAQAGEGKRVLFLVPSLALLSQSLTEWTQETAVPLHSFAVCSDGDVGKKRKKDDDTVQTFVHELQYPATTDSKRLADEFEKRHDKKHMSVVFATYHSIDVVSRAQKKFGLPEFDLVICDEAHRTTGAKFEGEDESHFVKVHDDGFLKAKKRLYMTATPRIYANAAKATAERDSIQLCSMDDEALYGPELHVITFSEAVRRGLLVDYKVIVLSIEEGHVSRRIQELLKDENNQLRVDDAAKIVGCWKALSKQGLREELGADWQAMKRAVAFCQVIEKSGKKVSSKEIASVFQQVVDAYIASEPTPAAPPEERRASERQPLRCEAAHVDGSMNATEKEEKIAWLKAETPDNTCRVLSNVRCLSEGVDVPALDAVLFLTPRSSQIDVVQSVGRVMRNAPGKTRGYIVLPVVIPAGVKPHEALNDNKIYGVVWQVLQALRSHDDRFDAMVNKLELTGADHTKMEIIAVTDKVSRRAKAEGLPGAGRTIGQKPEKPAAPLNAEFEFEVGELEHAIYAKLVEKVGNRRHWEDWAKDIAKIANTHIDRIQGILENKKNVAERSAFDAFVKEVRDDLNNSIGEDEAVEMLAQHLVTKPVFDALFAGNSFAAHNPMSVAMQKVLDVLKPHRLEKETQELEAFYASVKLRVEGITDAAARQKVIKELYEKFFTGAFKKMSDKLGIVYTPIEIVDFILKSVDVLLRKEFGESLSSPGVHILDPFTGTGTFITRLLQSGLIDKEALPRKYKNEIHANEIVLLAYYIAAINIETAYQGVVGAEKYEPFEGILLTDTFELHEKADLYDDVLKENSARRNRQKNLDIRVIVGNPPYSVGQDSTNDNNQNVAYPVLDERLSSTYAARSEASSTKALFDSYIRAIRWASDRVGERGIIGFVTNATFVDGSGAAGMRKCLAEEFSSLYVFHLRGNQRTAGELSRREGGKIFGSGSRAPVAISLLVKNPAVVSRGELFFRDVGDYQTREQKLAALEAAGDVAGVQWTRIVPDVHGDWVNQRDDSFARYLIAGDKETKGGLFETYSLGVNTGRDAWARSFSRRRVGENVVSMVDFYNSELRRFNRAHGTADRAAREAAIAKSVSVDPAKIGWTANLRMDFARDIQLSYESKRVVSALYRPFTKEWLYFARPLNERVYQQLRFFPVQGAENRVIGASAGVSRSGYSVLMADVVPSLHATDMVGSQYFPLFVYDEETGERRDGITDAGLKHFQDFYPAEKISKEDIFYYVYGLLHSADYRERYADNLGKELPRIPRVSKAEDFWAFSKAGRRLAELHVNYEQQPEYPAAIDAPSKPTFRVEKMRFGGKGKEKDKSVIQYNEGITVRNIPLEAYEYVVNGKSAIEWVMERQSVTVDKDSGIVKDANDYAKETMKDARYPLSLLLRVITVSLETVSIVKSLPRVDDAALARENQEWNGKRFVELRQRLWPVVRDDAASGENERVIAPPIEETSDGFVVSMMDVRGVVVERIHLDKNAVITKRVSA